MVHEEGYDIAVTGPLGDSISSYDRLRSPRLQHESAGLVDTVFIDAMRVREEVFVKEQGVPLDNELDDDDASSIHLVLYDKVNEEAKQPIGTIRILPVQSTLHTSFDKHRRFDESEYHGEVRSSAYDYQQSFITLGRLAVLKAHRRHGYAQLLVDTALSYATRHSDKLTGTGLTSTTAWNGLVLIHAQKQVQSFWNRCGFAVDEGLGIWDEEGMDHVAMWTRVNIA